jgi:hypothetical protein
MKRGDIGGATMSKLVKVLGLAAMLFVAVTSVPAQARWHGGGGWNGGGGWHHGWRGGGWGWGPGFGLGLGLGTAWGYPYYYGSPYYGSPYYGRRYYGGPACRWSRVRVWRYDHWAIRTVRRCW